MDRDTLGRSALSAFYGLWLSVSLGFVGVLLYLYGANRSNPFEISLTLFGQSHKYSLVWLVLSVAAVFNYFILRKEKSERRRHYLDVQRPVA